MTNLPQKQTFKLIVFRLISGEKVIGRVSASQLVFTTDSPQTFIEACFIVHSPALLTSEYDRERGEYYIGLEDFSPFSNSTKTPIYRDKIISFDVANVHTAKVYYDFLANYDELPEDVRKELSMTDEERQNQQELEYLKSIKFEDEDIC